MPTCLPFSTTLFVRFLIDFGSQLRPPDPQKSSSHCSESTIFAKSIFEVDIDFPSHFYPNLAPFWLPKSTKIRRKSRLRWPLNLHEFCQRFFIDFCSVLASNLGRLGPQDAAQTAQDAPRRRNEKRKKRRFVGLHAEPPFGRFWEVFERIF